MWVEELNLWVMDEQNNWKEVSEKDKQKVQEDSKKAKQVKKQIKDTQIKWKEIALFLSKVLWRYYDNWFIINIIHNFLTNIEKEYNHLVIIFSPFLDNNNKFKKTNDYIRYIKDNIKSLNSNHIELIVAIVEFEKLWWKEFWNILKKKEYDYNEFTKELKLELKR